MVQVANSNIGDLFQWNIVNKRLTSRLTNLFRKMKTTNSDSLTVIVGLCKINNCFIFNNICLLFLSPDIVYKFWCGGR